uniref:Med12-LCEWAV domain-containing protein n=1 Tax=Mesocestoides corti TaxID=53468 RepID=A0A5K3EY81_MESCO
MSKFPSYEDRPLKGKDTGPPDVYPQKPNQLEDALTDQLVKDGFKYNKPVVDEYKSGRKNCLPQDLDSVWDLYYNILVLKAQTAPAFEPENSPAPLKIYSGMDKEWAQLKDWLSDLSGANANRRSTIFDTSKAKILAELTTRRFPLSLALRLINKLIIHTTAPLENLKKKQKLDPTMEWTEELLKMIDKLFTGDLSNISAKFESICGDWDYLFGLLLALYDNDLVEHWDVLKCLASKLEHLYKSCSKSTQQDCPSFCSSKDRSNQAACDPLRSLKFVLPYFQRFCLRFTESELLTRRVLYWSCYVFSEFVNGCKLRATPNCSFDKPEDYTDLFVCAYHRPLLLSISSIIISLTLNCPSAAVWNKITTETNHSYLTGSPLDLLPCSLAFLPIPPGPEAPYFRKCLIETETALLERGRLAESGWCLFPPRALTSNECTDETNAEIFVRVLDELDFQDFSITRETHPIDGLFKKLFLPELLQSPRSLSALVIFLCKWAVSPTRTGLYRSIIVACLLEHLRSNLPGGQLLGFTFQTCLLTFLDQYAPTSPTAEPAAFRALVCLFAELIDRGIFNHDAFVRTYIARGVFDSSLHPLANNDHASVPSTTLHTSNNISNFSIQSEISEDNDRNSVDNPDSVRSDLCGGAGGGLPLRQSPDLNRHLQYLIHFPLPQDESYAHEQNQRAQLLYGSSMRAQLRSRDTLRKLSRDIGKLFTKSAYRLDVVHGELGKRKRNRERSMDLSGTPNNSQRSSFGTTSSAKESRSLEDLIEVIQTRFRSLNYYDMECVISKNMPTYLRVLSGTTSASVSAGGGGGGGLGDVATESFHTDASVAASSPSTFNSGRDPIYYPVHSSIFLFLELIETSLNIICLLDTVADTLERLQASSPAAPYPSMSSYLSLIWLRAIGVLRAHQAVLLTQPDLQQRIFACLIEQLRRGGHERLQSRRCILAYLKDLSYSSAYVKRLWVVWSQTLRSGDSQEAGVQPSPQRAFDSIFNQISLGRPSEIVISLRENSERRKVVVHDTLKEVLQYRDSERLAALFETIVDYSVQCNELALEWLPAMAALIGPNTTTATVISSSPNSPSTNVESGLRLDDPVAWDNLTSLIGTLLAHNCLDAVLLFEKLINPSLAHGLDQSSVPVDSRLEPTVRVACHILHRLFTAETVCQPSGQQEGQQSQSLPTFRVSEPLLLTGALQKVADSRGAYIYLIDSMKMLMIHSNKGIPLEFADEGGEDGSAAGSDDNSTDNDRDSDRDTDDGHADSSLDLYDGFDLTDGPPTSKNKRKRRRVHLASSKNKKRRGVNAKRNSAGSNLFNSRRRNWLPGRIHRSTCNFLTTGQPPSDSEVRAMPLRDFAHLVLREICVTPWVRENFYRIPGLLLANNVLIDNMISGNQTRFLLHIIYHPHDVKWVDLAANPENVAEVMLSLISGVNIWTLHSTRMELNLLCMHISPTSSKEALDQVANRIVTGFNEQALSYLRTASGGAFNDASSTYLLPEGLPEIEIPESDNSWYLPSLIAKLPHELKMQIVTKTCDILYGIKQFWRHKNDEDQERIVMEHSILLAHPVFSSILHVCMETVDPLERLYEQLECFVSGVKETRDRMPENLRTRHILQECLALRLSLLGICLSSVNLATDRLTSGALILAQLIGFGVTEPHSNQTLFFTCLDMLHTLVHNLASQAGPDSQQCQNLAKKVRKKLAERHFTVGIEYIRPLLFIGRTGFPFVAVAPLNGTAGSGNRNDGGGGGAGKLGGSSKFASGGSFKANSKSGGSNASRYGGGNTGNSGAGNLTSGGGVKSFSRKRGYAFISRDRFAPWDIYDVNRRPTFLAMCSAVEVPATQSRIEEQANLLLSHEHPLSFRRSEEFYLQSLFNDAEASVSSASTAAAVASPSPSSSGDLTAKQFVLGPVPPMKRQPGVESLPRRAPPQQAPRLPKPPTAADDLMYRQQQAQIRLQTPPSTQTQQPKRKRSRAAPQEEMLLAPPPPPPPPPQLYHQGLYGASQNSAMAAAQAVESAAAASTVTGKRKRLGGGMAGGAGIRRAVPQLNYDNGGMSAAVLSHQHQQPWPPRMAGPPPAGMPGRVPNQRQNLSDFVQNRNKAQQQQQKAAQQQQQQQQQQMAAAFAAGVVSMEERFPQQDPRFMSSGRGQGDPNYPFPEMMPSQSGGPFPDFQLESQLRHQRQQQQRYVGGQQQVVPDPPPYPGRVQHQAKATPMMQMLSSAPSSAAMSGQHLPSRSTPANVTSYMIPQTHRTPFPGGEHPRPPAPPPPNTISSSSSFSRLYDTGDYR